MQRRPRVSWNNKGIMTPLHGQFTLILFCFATRSTYKPEVSRKKKEKTGQGDLGACLALVVVQRPRYYSSVISLMSPCYCFFHIGGVVDCFSDGGIAVVGRHSESDPAASWNSVFYFNHKGYFVIKKKHPNCKPSGWLMVVVHSQ